MTSTFEVASKFKDAINEINWEKITSPVMETDDQINETRNRSLHEEDQSKVIFFWNNRNARRKHPGTLIFWFKDSDINIEHYESFCFENLAPDHALLRGKIKP